MIPDTGDLLARAELGTLRMLACPTSMYSDPLPSDRCTAPRHLGSDLVKPPAEYVIIAADKKDESFSMYWLWCRECWQLSELPIETIISAKLKDDHHVE